MKKAWFKTFHKPGEDYFLIGSIGSFEAQELAQQMVGRELTEEELESTFYHLLDDLVDEKLNMLHQAIEFALGISKPIDEISPLDNKEK